jgi:hypothetical protein
MPAILHLQTHTQGDGLGLGELRTNSSHRKRVEHFNYSYARWILALETPRPSNSNAGGM